MRYKILCCSMILLSGCAMPMDNWIVDDDIHKQTKYQKRMAIAMENYVRRRCGY